MIIIETLAGGDDDHTHTQIAGGNLFKRTKFFYSKEQSSSISYGNYLRKLPTEIHKNCFYQNNFLEKNTKKLICFSTNV